MTQKAKIADIENRWNAAEAGALLAAETTNDHHDPAYQSAEQLAEGLWKEFVAEIESLRRETGNCEDELYNVYAEEYRRSFPERFASVNDAHLLAMHNADQARDLHLVFLYRNGEI